MFWKELKATSLDELLEEIIKERNEPEKPLTLIKIYFDDEPNGLHLVKVENAGPGLTYYTYSSEDYLKEQIIK